MSNPVLRPGCAIVPSFESLVGLVEVSLLFAGVYLTGESYALLTTGAS
jgi:hypothetical protein